MKLKDVCQQTGLTRKTIRLYEEKGLLTPKKEYRNGREYREYSPEDVHTLNTIARLRRAWFTMDEILHMQQDPETIREIFPQYRQWLHLQKREVEALLRATDRILVSEVAHVDQLAQALAGAVERLPLPSWDVTPKFRYLDELEEVRNMDDNRRNIEQSMEETNRKTFRQTALIMDQDRINNQAITLGRIRELETGDWKRETDYVKQEEGLPKSLRVLSTVSFVVFLLGLAVLVVIYMSRMTLGASRNLPAAAFWAMGAMALGLVVYGAIRGYAAWKERRTWILKMQEQDREKAEKRRQEKDV